MSVLLGSEFVGGGGEDFGVDVDVDFGGGGRHEGHVVEGSEQDAAVESVEVEEALEFEVGGSGGFAPVAGRFGGESVFGAGAELDDVPRKMVRANFTGDAVVKALCERNHAFECGGREDVFESGAHGGQRERVTGERTADAADVAIFEMNAGGDALGNFFGDAERGAGNTAADGFAEDEHVGIEFPCGGASAGTGADGVSFVGDKKRAATASKFSGGGPVAVVGENDANVGHGGLGENASDIVMLEGVFEGVEIVKFDDAGGFGGIDGRADIAAARADDAVFERGEGFVNGAVVTVVEDEDFRALSDFAGN